MRGLVHTGVGAVDYRTDLPEPGLEAPTDAIVAVHAAGLCGSDLHPYLGREPARVGVVPGHELVGEVVAIGPEVRQIAVGDRVLAAFSTSCGRCAVCRAGLTARCPQGQLLGWGPTGPGRALHGAQAERVRIPLADGTLIVVPPVLDDGTALLCADNLPTAAEALERAAVSPGRPLAVVGLGSVGLCAVALARAAGIDRVLAVDPVGDRRDRAATLGATVATPTDAPALAARLAGDDGPGLPAVVEAAGSPAGQRLAFELTAPGGTLSVIAVQTTDAFAFTPVEAYDRNLTLRVGRASVRARLPDLLTQLTAGTLVAPTPLVLTHPDRPLADGPDAYARFAARAPGMVKASFRP